MQCHSVLCHFADRLDCEWYQSDPFSGHLQFPGFWPVLAVRSESVVSGSEGKWP